MQIDSGSPWAGRAQVLRLQTPSPKVSGAPAPSAAPAVTAPAASEPAIKLNLPTAK